jgi:hypothetical protein
MVAVGEVSGRADLADELAAWDKASLDLSWLRDEGSGGFGKPS